ncbi:sulfate reduction electron transfer complex DsrMKJOP subunit DsrP [Gordonibacter massiliensis (ex Traore et al. 2017)]|uniref:sulfate reduction electron transfer complex DsrMKJOP subunit DsrP n=1 Tax=Gordonibacter massiliensis (ex Traore et al. 2017) TaxID=1841863 RepID=UPI001C8C97F1|nr:NrfD/PsrC family molybdoenzyme membrane anchor subunit [Gordonibacter massiliensis (ex Traore et al. 2017)]MBX9034877.1 polysulfide reductase NrfD [Gordonibacter massiliensis (ex Traore et al. 2017)]
MLEKALHGSKGYYVWIAVLLLAIAVGVAAYANQLMNGLTLTGMSRDVSWGLYIAQFVFLVGVAASGVMVAIPFYLHHYQSYGKIVIIGEFMAVAAVLTAVLFVVVDLGQPMRVLNVILFPTPNSMLFWDMCVLSSYLIVNLVIGWTVLGAEKKGFPPPKWTHVLSLVAIPLAVGIHTVTAFLFSGLAGHDYWLTAIMAARFLASAFAAGPALLVVLCLILKKTAGFDVPRKALDSLAKTVCYAMIANVFFFLLEVFTAFYSNVPGHKAPLEYLFVGLDGHGQLVPFMWVATALAAIGIFLLLVPKFRRNYKTLVPALMAVFFACMIDKGLGLVLGGFVPNTFEQVVEYTPNINEVLVILGVYGIGFLVLTVLCKVAVGVRAKEIAPAREHGADGDAAAAACEEPAAS